MSARKPVLLRPSGLTGRVSALTGYRWINEGQTLEATPKGKHDVTADFDAIVMQTLLDPAPDIAYVLDKAAAGEQLDQGEAQQAEAFRAALVGIIERHNAALASRAEADR